MLFTGHSLGGALCTLCAVDVALLHPDWEVTMISFGSPRVGNHGFARLFDKMCPDAFRICNDCDLITSVTRVCPVLCPELP